MKLGIYSDDFLFDCKKRAKHFECLNCQLVSPKNYFMLCRHCLCQKCLKYYRDCPYDGSVDNKKNEIRLEGQKQNTFQFVIIENILHPFLMKCIFNESHWAGTYKTFIETHYYECEFRYGKSLLNEYFNDEHKKRNKDNKRKIKCHSEIKKRKSKNKLIELEEVEDEDSQYFSDNIQNDNFIYLTDNENDDNNSNDYSNSNSNLEYRDYEENSDSNNINDNYIVLDSEENEEEPINKNKNRNDKDNSDYGEGEDEAIIFNAEKKKIKIINDKDEDEDKSPTRSAT